LLVTSIEKVVPDLTQAMTLLRLLARSATGQDSTNYTKSH
jgi:L-lactate dehydrogenase complex protein LldF